MVEAVVSELVIKCELKERKGIQAVFEMRSDVQAAKITEGNESCSTPANEQAITSSRTS